LLSIAAVSVFYDYQRMLMSAVVGGILGLLNLRALSKNVKGLLGTEKAAGKLMFISFFRLAILFAVIFILLKKALVHPVGLLIGFTVIFTLIMIEGWREAKLNSASEGEEKDGGAVSH
jgi:hypothetical protein